MGAIWLLSMPDVLRRAGVQVETYPDWQTRARSSGGYDDLLGVQVHQTVSHTTPANDMAYMWRNAATRPIGAIHLARTGVATVGAAGATNTSGKGGPLGPIPKDTANRYVISIEAANDGYGEPWPVAQQEAYLKIVNALVEEYNLDYGVPGVHAHFEWSPGRKVDPRGPSRWAAGATQMWDMRSFRADAAALSAPPPAPPPTGYERIAVMDTFEAATADRWDTRGFGISDPKLKAGLPAGEYVCKLGGSAGKVGATVNLTIVGGPDGGFASAWKEGPRPNTSKVNYGPSQAAANECFVPLAADGSFRIYINTQAHIIVDLVGYWT